jgi:hypothetical protein
MVNDQLWLDTARDLFNISQQRKELERKEGILKETLKKLNNDQPLELEGFNFDYTLRPGPISYEAIPQLQGIDLEVYRKAPVKVWSLKITKV